MARPKMFGPGGVPSKWIPRTEEQKEHTRQAMLQVHARKRCLRALDVLIENSPLMPKPVQRRIKALMDSMLLD